jgi:protein-disulfide isomerase
MVLRDRQIGTLIGVKATPTMFINGEPLTGLPEVAELHRRLEDVVGQANAQMVAK